MKDIFEFNHIDKSLSESDVKPSKTFINTTTKNTGVLRNHIKVINFLMMFLQYLGYVWLQLELFLVG